MSRDATPTRAICRHCRRPIHLHEGVWAVDLGGVLREKCRWTRDKNNRAHVPEGEPGPCHSGHVPPDTTSGMRRRA